MVDIISMDFDGTLLTSDKKISDRTRRVLLNLKEKNYKIVGITARNLSSAREVVDISLFNYIILNNGASIYNVLEDKVINFGYIERNIAEELTKYFEDIAVQIDYCSLNYYYIKSRENIDNREFLISIEDIAEVKEVIARMNIFFKSEEELKKYRKKIEEEFLSVHVVSMIDTDDKNSKRWLAINPKGLDKYKTLKRFLEEIQTSVDKVIFFGDGENDLTLIEGVGLGVAMENAIGVVKERAKAVTLSNDEDGVAVFLENYFSAEKS